MQSSRTLNISAASSFDRELFQLSLYDLVGDHSEHNGRYDAEQRVDRKIAQRIVQYGRVAVKAIQIAIGCAVDVFGGHKNDRTNSIDH